MNWVVTHLVSPVIAASLALLGNYYLVEKPSLKQGYTKLGVDIMLDQQAPPFMHDYARHLLEGNSPVNISGLDKQAQLNKLMHHIPANLTIPKNMTFGDALARYTVLHAWVRDVNAVCPKCIDNAAFSKSYKKSVELLKIPSADK